MATGRPPKVSDEEILRGIATVYGPATVSDLIEDIDINRSGMNKRLDDLVERELVREKTVGANAVVYWLSDDGQKHLDNSQ
jgi:DNA-binding MarR family transcriptional regulator